MRASERLPRLISWRSTVSRDTTSVSVTMIQCGRDVLTLSVIVLSSAAITVPTD